MQLCEDTGIYSLVDLSLISTSLPSKNFFPIMICIGVPIKSLSEKIAPH